MWNELASRAHEYNKISWGKGSASSVRICLFSMQRKDVVRAFHADAKAESWTECAPRVGQAFYNRESASSITLLPTVLSQIPMLLFAGDQDLICNYVGIESIISAMTWNGETGLGVSFPIASIKTVLITPRRCKQNHGMSMVPLPERGWSQGT